MVVQKLQTRALERSVSEAENIQLVEVRPYAEEVERSEADQNADERGADR